jgi:hypothetical protein
MLYTPIFSEYDREMMVEACIGIDVLSDCAESIYHEFSVWDNPLTTPKWLRVTMKELSEDMISARLLARRNWLA